MFSAKNLQFPSLNSSRQAVGSPCIDDVTIKLSHSKCKKPYVALNFIQYMAETNLVTHQWVI
jgi:hypothetical protein